MTSVHIMHRCISTCCSSQPHSPCLALLYCREIHFLVPLSTGFQVRLETGAGRLEGRRGEASSSCLIRLVLHHLSSGWPCHAPFSITSLLRGPSSPQAAPHGGSSSVDNPGFWTQGTTLPHSSRWKQLPFIGFSFYHPCESISSIRSPLLKHLEWFVFLTGS